MPNPHDTLMTWIAQDDVAGVQQILATGIDLNVACDQGASPLFGAVLQGNAEIIRLLLDRGADPNFMAAEPACDIYAPKPLELALQARFLMNWDRFHPIVELLQQCGATDTDGKTESPEDLAVRQQRAQEWQTGKPA